MSKVFDCFLYNNEAEVLEIRLNELDPVVDWFVLCEATRTFNNEPKPLQFMEHKQRFARFLPKIKHVVIEDIQSDSISPHELEQLHRHALARALVDCAPHDIVIISDVDAIPSPDAIRTFAGPVAGLRMRLFCRYLNLEAVGDEEAMVRGVIYRYENLLGASARDDNAANDIVDNGGWRFSHLGDSEWSSDNGRTVWDFAPVDASYPAHVLHNHSRYGDLIVQGPPRIRLLGGAFESIYYGQERPEVLAIVPHDARRVLDLGCAAGYLGASLRQRQPCHVTGVEYVAEVAAAAATRLDRVVVGDCESLDLEALFADGEFDCLIAADILEHLRDPETLLRRLKRALTPDAAIVVSLPNVRHAGVLEAAVEGDWTYQQWGILDRTHLRFFTRREIDKMLTRLGFEVEERHSVDDPALAEWERLGRPRSARFGAMTIDGLDEAELREFFVVQWLVRGRAAAPTDLAVPSVTMESLAGQQAIDARGGLEEPAPPVRVTSRLSEIHELERVRAQAQMLQEELHRLREETHTLEQEQDRSSEHARTLEQALSHRDELLADSIRSNQTLVGERDAALGQLSAVLGSSSWRITAPLRRATRGRPTLSTRLRRLLRAPSRARRVLHRATRLMSANTVPHVRTRVAARLRRRLPATVRRSMNMIVSGSASTTAPSPVYRLQSIGTPDRLDQLSVGERGRIICVTHVPPYPPRAGNEYRIHRMLSWLQSRGWDVLLLVYPLSDAPMTSQQITEAAALYPNIVVCQADGTVFYRLRDGGSILHGLRGKQPREFGAILKEDVDGRPGASKLLQLMRKVCPDVLIELLLHVEAEFHPDVLLAEYVFMTRPFALLDPRLMKVIDTIDIFSTTQAKVARFGVDDRLAIEPELEAELLDRADLLIAIQPDEAATLRELAPRREVISVGVDFSLIDHEPRASARPVVLLVGSSNPYNVRGLRDFLRFAWPLVRKAVPEAELHVIGSVGNGVDPLWPGIRVLGRVEDLTAAYAEARVVVNPTIAGTGLKIKTVEALCHLRPVVAWPSGVDGLPPELRDMCQVAGDWYDFARRVVDLTADSDSARAVLARKSELATQFAPENVYAPLEAALGRV